MNRACRKFYRERLQDFSKIISKDLVMCVAYYDKTFFVNSRVDEIAEYIEIAKKMKLSSREYRKYLLPWPATNNDARIQLMLFKTECCRTGGQPDFEITKNMIEHLSYSHFYMISYFLPILSKKYDFNRLKIEEYVRKAIDPNNL